MKRFLAVLAVLAVFVAACGVDRASEDTLAEDAVDGSEAPQQEDDTDAGNDDEAEADGDAATSTPSTTAPLTPPTTGPPNEPALQAEFDDAEWEITHGELNELVASSQDNEEFINLVFQGTLPPTFTVIVLTENLVSEAVRLELEEVGATVSDENVADARDRLLASIATLYPGADDPAAEAERLYGEVSYLTFLVDYQAAQDALTGALSEAAEPGEGSPCVSHILVDTEAEGDAIITRLNGGEDFAGLAVELSTGPSGPTGGDLGCADASNYVPEFADAVSAAELGEFVGPIETQFGWHVILVDRYEIDGRPVATERLRERLGAATVDVDENLGTWDGEQLVIVPAGA